VTTATVGGMSSAFLLLEIAHTHYWQRDPIPNKLVSSTVIFFSSSDLDILEGAKYAHKSFSFSET